MGPRLESRKGGLPRLFFPKPDSGYIIYKIVGNGRKLQPDFVMNSHKICGFRLKHPNLEPGFFIPCWAANYQG